MSAEKLPVPEKFSQVSQPLKLSDLWNTSIQAILDISKNKSVPKEEPKQ